MKNKKKCSRCQIERKLEEFHNRKESPDGKNWVCRECALTRISPYKKRNLRLCIGPTCRGLKKFNSIGGARLCYECRRIVDGMGDYYGEQIVINGRSKRSS